ncbi:MAG: ATP-binding protein, partial [Geodermatophilaceae bacterium]
MARNPFTPTFGVSPPLLVAREDELASFAEALDDGPGAPGRAMLFTGARGSGKTVLLNAVEEEARARGWLVISATVRPGVAQEIAAVQLPALLREH